MIPKTRQLLSAKHSDREWGSCQDLSPPSCKTTNGTILQLVSGGKLFIAAVMTADECFDGILDLIHDSVTTFMSDIKGRPATKRYKRTITSH